MSEAKPAGYYGAPRADLVARLPQPIGRTLDVGCGEGGVARSLRAAGATQLVGIEVMPDAAEIARGVLDTVITATVEDALAGDALEGPFDTICCYDVLEHLVDPVAVVERLLAFAAPGGRLHISIPNARHFSLIWDLVFRGTFGYTSFGHRDNTHLRWYTRRDLSAMVDATGWHVQSVQGAPFGGNDRYADRATLGLAREFLTLQWHLLATAAAP